MQAIVLAVVWLAVVNLCRFVPILVFTLVGTYLFVRADRNR